MKQYEYCPSYFTFLNMRKIYHILLHTYYSSLVHTCQGGNSQKKNVCFSRLEGLNPAAPNNILQVSEARGYLSFLTPTSLSGSRLRLVLGPGARGFCRETRRSPSPEGRLTTAAAPFEEAGGG
jgi:hypothetical protein